MFFIFTPSSKSLMVFEYVVIIIVVPVVDPYDITRENDKNTLLGTI